MSYALSIIDLTFVGRTTSLSIQVSSSVMKMPSLRYHIRYYIFTLFPSSKLKYNVFFNLMDVHIRNMWQVLLGYVASSVRCNLWPDHFSVRFHSHIGGKDITSAFLKCIRQLTFSPVELQSYLKQFFTDSS